jgi:hypothetical protein
MNCFMCGKPVNRHPASMTAYRMTGRGYCSTQCSNAYRSKISSTTMARTNREYASDRMKTRNPMRLPESRAKMSATLQAIGHAPKLRGGNGRPPTEAERTLFAMFASIGFEPQVNIRTGYGPGNGVYPTVYKPDMGNWALKIALEADGSSHTSHERRAQDVKKDAFLRGLGWTVLRFSNEQILKRPTEVWMAVTSLISKLTVCTPT